MQLETLKTLFKTHKEKLLFGRYIHHGFIAPLLKKFDKNFSIDLVGTSVNSLPVYTITLGHGDKKVLMWSQMHGNESTTTKAIFDMLNAFAENTFDLDLILEQCTIKIIPILNPDGALAYTRHNANDIDLNRDAQDLSQPESRVLRSVFEKFKPHFCYNLHGQRTIFSAGHTNKSATVSFLAPAQDAERTVTSSRMVAMEIITVMNKNLQLQIKDQVGIYDDGFNINCVGDTFQAKDVPTVLFEAGHFTNDYMREQTREFMFQSLLVSLSYIANNVVNGHKYATYLDIPKNEKLFYDIIIRNTSGLDVAVQFHERLVGGEVKFIPKIEKISDLSDFNAHKELNANGYQVFGENNTTISEGNENDFVVINNEKFLLKP
ncbi:M14 family zinc carboxypeptidase [Psychroserpens luteolus]|uniref:M14 family zinc carboxypeptidase n=1 Tax=Psychroserpens luteolus TaxID=2855840 RepID=UPI001E51B1EF|nr:M14 family zinc carboxypeptidase [Psychroserpens luteolus]MCD2258973.1 peptidase M14 [Psychroserpens luteolus]